MREQAVSEWFLPYGRLLRCELVNTVDSTNIETPIIGLVIEDAWNGGRVIIPAGTEVHSLAQKSPSPPFAARSTGVTQTSSYST
jgi:hypothetical protein